MYQHQEGRIVRGTLRPHPTSGDE